MPQRCLHVVLAVVCLWSSACTTRRGASPDTPPAKLRIGTALPKAGMAGAGIQTLIDVLSNEVLFSVAWDGRIVPRIGDRWEWFDEGQGLRLTLNSGVVFHDGTVLTADVVVGIIRDKAAKREGLTYESIREVRAVNDRTIEILLHNVEGFLPSELTDLRIKSGKHQTIGTGPFVLDADSLQSGEPTLRRFERYHQGRPAIETIELVGYPTLRNAWSALMRGDINVLYEVGREAVDFVEAQPSVHNHTFTRAYYTFLAFNMRHPVLGRRDVRQALSHAIDREEIVAKGMNGRGEVADGPIWKYHWAYSVARRTYTHNAEAAKLRLDAAGLTSGSRGAAAMPSRFRFTALMFGEDPRFERVGLVLQKQLYEMGVDMQIEPVSLSELNARMKTGRFDALLIEITSGRSLMWLYNVWHSQSDPARIVFDSGYRSADAALNRLRRASGDAEIRAAVSEAQQVLYDDPPALFLAWPQTSRAVSASIEAPDRDVPSKPGADIMGRIWQWRATAQEVARR